MRVNLSGARFQGSKRLNFDPLPPGDVRRAGALAGRVWPISEAVGLGDWARGGAAYGHNISQQRGDRVAAPALGVVVYVVCSNSWPWRLVWILGARPGGWVLGWQ